MKSLFIFFSIFLCAFDTSALDEIYSPNIDALFNAELIVTCKARPLQGYDSEIEIFNVLKNETSTSFETGSKLIVKGDFWGHIEQKGAYILYLNKHNTHWSPYTHQHQYPLKKGLIPFRICDSTFYLNVRDYRIMRKQIFRNFQLKDQCHLIADIPHTDYKKSQLTLNVVHYLYQQKDRLCHPHWNDEVSTPVYKPLPLKADTIIHLIFDNDPYFVNGPEAYQSYLSENFPDSILYNAYGIEGKFYVRFVIEKDGNISNLQMLSSPYAAYDSIILELIKNIPPMVPGKVRGKFVRSQYTLPVPIRKKN